MFIENQIKNLIAIYFVQRFLRRPFRCNEVLILNLKLISPSPHEKCWTANEAETKKKKEKTSTNLFCRVKTDSECSKWKAKRERNFGIVGILCHESWRINLSSFWNQGLNAFSMKLLGCFANWIFLRRLKSASFEIFLVKFIEIWIWLWKFSTHCKSWKSWNLQWTGRFEIYFCSKEGKSEIRNKIRIIQALAIFHSTFESLSF